MTLLRDPFRLAFVAGTFAAALIVGCSSSNSPVAPSRTPSPSPSGSVGTFAFAQGTQNLTGDGGYSGSIMFPTAPLPSGVTATYTLSVQAPADVPTPAPTCSPSYTSGTPLVYLTFSPAANVSFMPSPDQTFTLPSSNSPTGHVYYTAFDDVDHPTEQCLSAPGTVVGHTITFTGGSGGGAFNSGDTYVNVLLQF